MITSKTSLTHDHLALYEITSGLYIISYTLMICYKYKICAHKHKKNCFDFFCTQISRLFLLWLWIIVMLQFYWLLIIKKFSHSIQKMEWCDKKWNFNDLRRKMVKNYVIERRRCFCTINEENISKFKAIVAMTNKLRKRRGGGECLKKLMKNILLA